MPITAGMGRQRRPRRDAAWNPPSGGGDATPLFAVLAAASLLVPLASRFGFVLFAIPLVTCALAVPRCLAAARERDPAAAWRSLAGAAALAAVASGLAAGSAAAPVLVTPAFYVGAGASALLLGGVARIARRSIAGASTERIVDALLLDSVVVALAVWFVAIPGFEHHDAVLTMVFVIDVCALAVASVATLAVTNRSARRIGWYLVLCCASACVGDGFVVGAHGAMVPAVTASGWALAGLALIAASADRRDDAEAGDIEPDGARWTRIRI